MILDQSQQEIKIHANFLKLKSDTDTHQGSSLFGVSSARHGFSAMDLVNYNGNKNAGLVLQVNEDYLKVINEQGKIENVKIADLGKKTACSNERWHTWRQRLPRKCSSFGLDG